MVRWAKAEVGNAARKWAKAEANSSPRNKDNEAWVKGKANEVSARGSADKVRVADKAGLVDARSKVRLAPATHWLAGVEVERWAAKANRCRLKYWLASDKPDNVRCKVVDRAGGADNKAAKHAAAVGVGRAWKTRSRRRRN